MSGVQGRIVTGTDPTTLSRSDFGWAMQISSRWADCDAYGHVNNAMYYNWIDTAVTTLAIQKGILRAPNQTSIGLCVASSCQFLQPISFPQTVDICVRLSRIGDRSLSYEAAIFALDEARPAAIASFSHVYVNQHSRRSVVLSQTQKDAVSDLLK